MSSDTAYLALMLDAPMQSWGFSSRFQRRTTGLHPTKSGIIGMICAAMGLAKGSPEEKNELMLLRKVTTTTVVIPRKRRDRWSGDEKSLDVLRLEDYHTVLKTRAASGGIKKNTVVTHRQYLLDAKFGIILKGEWELLEKVKLALENPVWGIWFGRKNCIPAEPVWRGLFESREEAEKLLLGDKHIDEFTRIEEADFSGGGNDTWSDGVPESFNDMRPWPVRRIEQQVGNSDQNQES